MDHLDLWKDLQWVTSSKSDSIFCLNSFTTQQHNHLFSFTSTLSYSFYFNFFHLLIICFSFQGTIASLPLLSKTSILFNPKQRREFLSTAWGKTTVHSTLFWPSSNRNQIWISQFKLSTVEIRIICWFALLHHANFAMFVTVLNNRNSFSIIQKTFQFTECQQRCEIRRLRNKDDGLNVGFSAFIAGLSSIFGKSVEISMYFVAKVSSSRFVILLHSFVWNSFIHSFIHSFRNSEIQKFFLLFFFSFYFIVWGISVLGLWGPLQCVCESWSSETITSWRGSLICCLNRNSLLCCNFRTT
jgi:hypothetical protein